MNSEMQKRLYEMEVTPPRAVWEKLSVNIDEINEDNRLAKKVLNVDLLPPAGVWEKIDSTINVVEEKKEPKKGIVINLKKLAVAALFIGLIATVWLLIKNSRNSAELAGAEKPAQQQTSTDTNSTTKKAEELNPTGILPEQSISINSDASAKKTIASIPGQSQSGNNKSSFSRSKANRLAQPTIAQYPSLNEPLEKSFKEPIDDLSLVTSDQNYLTMVNANGRLVKIPAQLASLAPHLQDKPISEDYYEVLFGEGTYWKETLNEWRKKVVSAPVSAGDAFTSFVELLKNVQNR